MASIAVLLCCVLFHVSVICELTPEHDVFKRATSVVKCEGKPIDLCTGGISDATSTSQSIQKEAEQNKGSRLYKAYNKMTSNNANYLRILRIGKKLGLSKNEAEAVHLYTMDSIRLHDELNTGLREGNNKYPALHYWLDRALKKLPKPETTLYRGYKHTVNVKTDTVLRLPGFSSTSTDMRVAKINFSSPGCTIMEFDLSKQAGSVADLSAISNEKEYVIPPTESFNVYKITLKDNYRFIYLRPVSRSRRDTTVVTLCGGCGAQTYSPIVVAIILIHRFFNE